MGRQTRLRAKEGRGRVAKARKRTEDGEYAGLLDRDSKRECEAQRRVEEDQYALLPEEDMRKTREAQRRAQKEEFPRLPCARGGQTDAQDTGGLASGPSRGGDARGARAA